MTLIMRMMQSNDIVLERSDYFSSLIGYADHFFTTTRGGVSQGAYSSLNLGEFSGDDIENVKENRRRLAAKIGLDSNSIIVPHEHHGADIYIVDEDFFARRSDAPLDCDALITTMKGVCIAVTTADCVPILISDKRKHVIAAVHAGWRGLYSEISVKTIEKMHEVFSSEVCDVCVAIGPCISQQCYEVGDELATIFTKMFREEDSILFDKVGHGRHYLDLRQIAKLQLQKFGVEDENIWIHGGCTYTDEDKFFSARRQGVNSGRMLSGIFIR